jgi:methylthioribose-1-phosphate isomerase
LGYFITFYTQVRGAPAIAIIGSLSLAVELRKLAAPETKKDLHSLVKEKLDYLVTSRPTTVNMQLAEEACIKLSNNLVDKDSVDAAEAKDVVT